MQAIKFNEQNEELGNGLPGYYNVPIYKCENAQGSVIMKIQMTKEEWEEIQKNDFCFWYTRECGSGGLQPFSFQTSTPFVQQFTIQDLTPSGLESFLQPGSRLGNYHVSKDVTLFEVITMVEGGVSLKSFGATHQPLATSIYSFQQLSEMLTASEYNADWFVIYPKN